MKTPNINQILRDAPVNSNRGAPMGASSYNDGTDKLYLQRVYFVDGDYAPDGTYWGNNGVNALYCAFNDNARIYVRAMNRKDAKTEVLKQFPTVELIK